MPGYIHAQEIPGAGKHDSMKRKKTKKRQPKAKQEVKHIRVHWDINDLYEHGIEATGEMSVMVRCRQCGFEWGVRLGSKGEVPENFWVCPLNKCNCDKEIIACRENQ